MTRRISVLSWSYILMVTGALLALMLQPGSVILHTLHISETLYHSVVISVIPSYAIMWFSAFYAFGKLEQYSKKLNKTKEYEAFRTITIGVGIMAWGMALSTILSLLQGAVTVKNPGLIAWDTILSNYEMLIVSLAGLVVISNGTRRLMDLASLRPSHAGMKIFASVFIAIGVLFTYFVTRNQGHPNNPYFLSAYLVMLTIIVPYIFAWFFGLHGVYEILIYAQRSKGVIYRHALSFLASGIAIVILASIAVRYLDGAYASTGYVSVAKLLTVMYCFSVVRAGGFGLIALGAIKLKKIEEI